MTSDLEHTTERNALLDWILTSRSMEFTLVECAEQRLTPGPIHSAAGHEWVAALFSQALGPDDWLAPHYRSHPWFLARQHDWRDVLRIILDPPQAGDDVIHLRPTQPRMVTPSGIVAQQLPVGAGLATALRYRATGGAAVVSCGDGALTIGIFLETLVSAAANDLPLAVVVEDNGVQNYALTSEISTSVSAEGLAELSGVGFRRIVPDDLPAALAVVREALTAARSGRPVLVDAVINLEHPHLIRPDGQPLIARGLELDTPSLLNDYVRGLARACEVDDDELASRADRRLDEMRTAAAAIIDRRDTHGPAAGNRRNGSSRWARRTLPPLDLRPTDPEVELPIRTWVDGAMAAAGDGLWISQTGISQHNGETGATRTVEMPIAERCMLGLGVGVSLAGMRVLVDVSVVNFSLVGLDMLATALPTYRRRSTSPVGAFMAVGAFGTGHQVGEQHDWDCLELLTTLPVDRVVVPGTRAQATRAAAAWWTTSECWVVALPQAAMLDFDAYDTRLFGAPPTESPDVVLVAWGYDVRDVVRADEQLRANGVVTAGLQVVDVLHPLPANLPLRVDTPVLVVASESNGASIVARVTAALRAAGLERCAVLHRSEDARGPNEIVAAAHDLLRVAS